MRRTTPYRRVGAIALAATMALLSPALRSAPQGAGSPGERPARPTLEETRLAMGKWIETQQILSRERNDWQQGKEILLGRLELVRKEVATLKEKIEQARAGVAEGQAKRDELAAGNDRLAAMGGRLTEAATAMEGEVRRLMKVLPAPLEGRLGPLAKRIPEDPANTRVSAAERFQNVLGILNELNKAHQEVPVHYEVRTLADGKPSEVQVVYVGLAQAYYVSARGEAGIGRPGADGWTWEPAAGVAGDIQKALEIRLGKQSPAFVPLSVKLQ